MTLFQVVLKRQPIGQFSVNESPILSKTYIWYYRRNRHKYRMRRYQTMLILWISKLWNGLLIRAMLEGPLRLGHGKRNNKYLGIW